MGNSAGEIVDKAVKGILGVCTNAKTAEMINENIKKTVLITHMIRLRDASGLTQSDLAKRMKCHVNKVVAIESLDDQEKMTLCDFRMYIEGLGL